MPNNSFKFKPTSLRGTNGGAFRLAGEYKGKPAGAAQFRRSKILGEYYAT